jgi:hypothetical protein
VQAIARYNFVRGQCFSPRGTQHPRTLNGRPARWFPQCTKFALKQPAISDPTDCAMQKSAEMAMPITNARFCLVCLALLLSGSGVSRRV